jgi:hypothetical protein
MLASHPSRSFLFSFLGPALRARGGPHPCAPSACENDRPYDPRQGTPQFKLIEIPVDLLREYVDTQAAFHAVCEKLAAIYRQENGVDCTHIDELREALGKMQELDALRKPQ